eukprot:scaffold2911_cov414-Prasinococcus_capsulatus_cf.AAC.27
MSLVTTWTFMTKIAANNRMACSYAMDKTTVLSQGLCHTSGLKILVSLPTSLSGSLFLPFKKLADQSPADTTWLRWPRIVAQLQAAVNHQSPRCVCVRCSTYRLHKLNSRAGIAKPKFGACFHSKYFRNPTP